ncbi:CWC16 protein [Scheffersomyces xylosifermentans]|uniref:CWC16 protein n=1 Tax=Scheffersomyces xylosifermentans TaxID=1304137 RepID=UPI00315D7553
MSERKAINKYYPPDWDPSQTVKRKKNPNQTIKIRMMAPYSMRCTKCNEYIAERRSFNARKETTNEKYLSIKIIRFHITCPRCNNHISFKTNPQTAGYTPEEGAVRNYEPTRKVTSTNVPKDRQETEDELLERLQKEEEESEKYQLLREKRKKNPFWNKQESLQNGDVYENLEKRISEHQREQEINEHLEELQFRNSRLQAKGGSDKLIEDAKAKIEQEIQELEKVRQSIQEEEDAKSAKEAFKEAFKGESSTSSTSVDSKKRVVEDERTSPPRKKVALAITLKKKKLENKENLEEKEIRNKDPKIQQQTLQSAIGGYSSSEEED